MRWRKGGPALFAVEALGLPEKWDEEKKEGVHDWQWEASRALVERQRVSIRSGHRVGKSAFLSWSILWFLTCYFPTKVGCTAPTATQMSDVLWAELALWHARLSKMSPELGSQFEWTTDEFRVRAAPKLSFAVARTARAEKPEALQGLHSENTMVIADEATGIPDIIFEAARGTLAAENSFVILTSNPTRTNGYFHETHHRLRSLWYCMQVNGESVPTQSQQFRDEIAFQFGKDSNVYRVRVLGEFANEDADVVIPLDLCEAAKMREVEPFGERVWGVDVARFGNDRTVLIKRCTNATLEKHKSWNGQDTMQTAGRIYAEWLDTPPSERPRNIFVDVIGIGAGVADRLMELQLPVVPVNVAESASINEKYMRLRDELWFKTREWLEKKSCKLVDDEVLVGELTIPKYTFTSTGKLKVESKEEMKKRTGARSPDVGDALVLTFCAAAEHKGAQSYEPTAWADS